MIVNLHIRNDFRQWVEPIDLSGRVMAVCGVRTTGKFAGIPSITEQPVFYDGTDSGWCLPCCAKALETLNVIVPNIEIPSEIKPFYMKAMNIMIGQLTAKATTDLL